MSFENGCSKGREALGYWRGLHIGAGDFVSEIQQYFGDPAHADTADAYEMDALDPGEHTFFSADDADQPLMIDHFLLIWSRRCRKGFHHRDTESQSHREKYGPV